MLNRTHLNCIPHIAYVDGLCSPVGKLVFAFVKSCIDQASREKTIIGSRGSALLEVTQGGGTHIVEAAAFGLENVGKEFAVIVRIGFFVDDDQEESTPVFEGLVHAMRILIDFRQSRVFFIQVGVLGARGDARHEG